MTADEHIGFNGRFAAALTKAVGTMWVVYFTTLFVLAWIALATFGPLHSRDPYPFPFLLFIGNVVQLLLVFVILVGQQVIGRAADKRSLQTYADAEEIFKEIVELHDHLVEQDRILNQGISLVETQPHPWIADRKVTPPPTVTDQYVGPNGRITAWITKRVGSMWAFYVATLFQFGWIGLSVVGVITFDPYPFAFLLFLSSLSLSCYMPTSGQCLHMPASMNTPDERPLSPMGAPGATGQGWEPAIRRSPHRDPLDGRGAASPRQR